MKHLLRWIASLANGSLRGLASRLDQLYACSGRASMPAEQVVLGVVVLAMGGLWSEGLLSQQWDDGMVCRWFVGLGAAAAMRHQPRFSKNREGRLKRMLAPCLKTLLSNGHFSWMCPAAASLSIPCLAPACP